MQLLNYPVAALRWLSRHKQSTSPQMVATMSGMVLARTLPMLVATFCSTLVAVEIYNLERTSWPLYWIASEIVLVAVRLYLIGKAKTDWLGRDWAILPYVVAGLAWSIMIGTAAYLSAMSSDPIVILLAATVIMGLIGAITARNSPLPRASITFLLIISIPYLAGIFRNYHRWEGPLAVMVSVSVIGMIALTEHLYTQVVNLITAERQNAFMAKHDILTGLLNRAGFHEKLDELLERCRLEKSKSKKAWFSVLCLDLDGFKGVNDTLGHAAGDAVLCGVADRIRELILGGDFAARISGDEFVIVLPDKNAALAQDIAQLIIDAISAPFHFGANWPVNVTASIGIASAPFHATDAAGLLARADAALYAAKAAGKGIFYLFQPGLYHTDLLAELREALAADDQLILYYQPLVDSRTNRIVAREALLRWNHPKLGLLPPHDFIPTAERSRLMIPLGARIIRLACEEAVQWADNTRVAVNVASCQLGERGLVDAVLEALEATGLPAHRLELEIVETTPVLRTPQALADLTALRHCGVSMALDDFPSGYSTLAALNWFNFDRIKLDGEAINAATVNPRNMAILRASVALARELGMQVTAEGVETEAHQNIARLLGADEVQGYLFGRPKRMAHGEILSNIQ